MRLPLRLVLVALAVCPRLLPAQASALDLVRQLYATYAWETNDAEMAKPARTSSQRALMNVWRLPGYEQVRFSGVNAAAMSVTAVRPDEWLLECSDGYGLEAPTFDDLVVRVRVERAVER